MPTDPPKAPAHLDDLGAYRLDGFIAAGAMGELWRAHHRQLGHPVAIKVITRAYAHEPRFRDGLRREVQAMAGLRHAGIAAMVDTGCSLGNTSRPVAQSMSARPPRAKADQSRPPVSVMRSGGAHWLPSTASTYAVAVPLSSRKPPRVQFTSISTVTSPL